MTEALERMRVGQGRCHACGGPCFDIYCSNICKMRESPTVCAGCGGRAWTRRQPSPHFCLSCKNRRAKQRYSPEDCIEAMVRWVREYGVLPSKTDWNPARGATPEQRARYEEGEWPSTATVHRLVGWSEAKRQATSALHGKGRDDG